LFEVKFWAYIFKEKNFKKITGGGSTLQLQDISIKSGMSHVIRQTEMQVHFIIKWERLMLHVTFF
jgi:hypothetical protein